MKILVVLSLMFALSWASAEPRKQTTETRRRHEHAAHHKGKDTVKKTKHGRQHGLSKVHSKLFKKFAMISVPSAVPLEEPAALRYPVSQPAVQQVMVPFTRPLQTSASTEMVSSYSSTPAQPSQLGTEVAGDQIVPNSAGAKPATVQLQGGQAGTVPTGEVKTGTQETAAVAQPGVAGVAQPEVAGVAQPEVAGGAQTEAGGGAQTVAAGGAQTAETGGGAETVVAGGVQTAEAGGGVQPEAAGGAETVAGGGAETIDPNAGSSSAQSLAAADVGKEDGLQMYNGGGAMAESEQVKPQVDGAAPAQEEVKVVNLGDDEKTANQEDRPCGGCPMNAKCVNGQCQIREEDAQTQGLTGKGSANNPGTVGDIHNLESQELKTLLKEATSADTVPGATSESPAGFSGPAETQDQEQTQGEQQGQTSQQGMKENQQADQLTTPQPSQQGTTANQQADQLTTPQPSQQDTTANQHADQLTTPQLSQPTQQRPSHIEPRFSNTQVKELRDFARMYKMYQFIRKMEERINDPDCAPICRKICKSFCLAKCCLHHHGNNTLQPSMAHTVGRIQGTGVQPSKISQVQDAKSTKDDEESKEKAEDDEMNEKAGRKHVFVNIVKNNVLDKPRRHLGKTYS